MMILPCKKKPYEYDNKDTLQKKLWYKKVLLFLYLIIPDRMRRLTGEVQPK